MSDGGSIGDSDAPRPGAVLVLAGGGAVDRTLLATLLTPVDAVPVVIAADSGALLAASVAVPVHHLVGDLDSLDAATVDRLAAGGTTVHRHPVDKDETDLELALALALDQGAAQVIVLGGGGGRLDHLVANALVLAAPRWAGMRIDAVLGDARVHIVRDERQLLGEPGEVVSLLAVGGPARGVRTSGLRYALHGEVLHPGSARGMSNVLIEPAASIALDDGVLLAIRPGPDADTPR